MGASKCYSFLKCLVIFLNIVFLVLGLVVVTFAGWALWSGVGVAAGESGARAAARAGLAALGAWGAALAAAGALGAAGAARRGAGALAAALLLSALCAVAEAAAACWGAAHAPALHAQLAARLHRALENEYSVLPASTQIIDAIQIGLECCGVDGVRDWEHSAYSAARAADPAAAELAAPLDADHVTMERRTLNLSVGAPPTYYYVPPSCCVEPEDVSCLSWTRLPASALGAGVAGGAVRGAGCGARALAALGAGARPALAGGAGLLAAHAAALLATLALALANHNLSRYKA